MFPIVRSTSSTRFLHTSEHTPWEQNLPVHLHTSSSFTLNHNWEPMVTAHFFTKSLAPADDLPLWSPPLKEPPSPPTQGSPQSSSPKLILLNILHNSFPSLSARRPSSSKTISLSETLNLKQKRTQEAYNIAKNTHAREKIVSLQAKQHNCWLHYLYCLKSKKQRQHELNYHRGPRCPNIRPNPSSDDLCPSAEVHIHIHNS